MRKILAAMAVLAGWLAAPRAGLAATVVTSVTARLGVVEIATANPPNFTTFTMSDPPRLVVDLSDATLEAGPQETPVGQGDIVSVKTLNYGGSSGAVARVIISYTKDTPTDILTRGNTIVVQPEASNTAPAETPEAFPPLPEPQPKPSPMAAAATAPAGGELRSPNEASGSPSAPSPAPREAAAETNPTSGPASAVASPNPPPDSTETLAPHHLPPLPPPPADVAASSPPPAAPPSAATPAKVAVAAPPPAPPLVATPRNSVALAPSAATTAPRRHEQAPTTAESLALHQPPAPPEPKPLNVRPPLTPEKLRDVAPPLAQADRPMDATPPPPAEQPTFRTPSPAAPALEAGSISKRRKRLALVGLRFDGTPSVFIRTNEPVAYRVREQGEGVIITIDNTRIERRNDTRPLDAHFFDSPIGSVRARQVRRNVEVEVTLKTHSSYQTNQSGAEVSLSFPRS